MLVLFQLEFTLERERERIATSALALAVPPTDLLIYQRKYYCRSAGKYSSQLYTNTSMISIVINHIKDLHWIANNHNMYSPLYFPVNFLLDLTIRVEILSWCYKYDRFGLSCNSSVYLMANPVESSIDSRKHWFRTMLNIETSC